MPRIIDLTGKRFGMLVVLRRDERHHGRHIRWICRCDCGLPEKSVRGGHLNAGRAKSCGCNANITHGMHGSREYKSWEMMIQRCTNERYDKFSYYGGRGITVCERWLKFKNFFADMGKRPADRSLDRIDVNGNYEPQNCRWATKSEQMFNRRRPLAQ